MTSQHAFHPYERLMEFGTDEACGCGSGLLYGDCCFRRDRARPRLADAVSFALQFAGGLREPPPAVVQAVLQRSAPPPLVDVLRVK